MTSSIRASMGEGVFARALSAVGSTAREIGSAIARLVGRGDKGIVYLRRDLNALTHVEDYVGQVSSEARFLPRQAEHFRDWLAANPGATSVPRFDYSILGRTPAGLKLDVLEESWIRLLGGPKRYGGLLSNQRWQMNPARYDAAGGKVPRP